MFLHSEVNNPKLHSQGGAQSLSSAWLLSARLASFSSSASICSFGHSDHLCCQTETTNLWTMQVFFFLVLTTQKVTQGNVFFLWKTSPTHTGCTVTHDMLVSGHMLFLAVLESESELLTTTLPLKTLNKPILSRFRLWAMGAIGSQSWLLHNGLCLSAYCFGFPVWNFTLLWLSNRHNFQYSRQLCATFWY